MRRRGRSWADSPMTPTRSCAGLRRGRSSAWTPERHCNNYLEMVAGTSLAPSCFATCVAIASKGAPNMADKDREFTLQHAPDTERNRPGRGDQESGRPVQLDREQEERRQGQPGQNPGQQPGQPGKPGQQGQPGQPGQPGQNKPGQPGQPTPQR